MGFLTNLICIFLALGCIVGAVILYYLFMDSKDDDDFKPL